MNSFTNEIKYCQFCSNDLTDKQNYKVCDNCKRGTYFNPLPAVGALCINSDGRILLIKRKIDPYIDYWDTPGGFVSLNENAEQAVLRELNEEVGANAENPKYIGSFNNVYNFQGIEYNVMTLMFLCDVPNTKDLKADDDAKSFEFIDLNDIDYKKIAFPEQSSFLQHHLQTNYPGKG